MLISTGGVLMLICVFAAGGVMWFSTDGVMRARWLVERFCAMSMCAGRRECDRWERDQLMHPHKLSCSGASSPDS